MKSKKIFSIFFISTIVFLSGFLIWGKYQTQKIKDLFLQSYKDRGFEISYEESKKNIYYPFSVQLKNFKAIQKDKSPNLFLFSNKTDIKFIPLKRKATITNHEVHSNDTVFVLPKIDKESFLKIKSFKLTCSQSSEGINNSLSLNSELNDLDFYIKPEIKAINIGKIIYNMSGEGVTAKIEDIKNLNYVQKNITLSDIIFPFVKHIKDDVSISINEANFKFDLDLSNIKELSDIDKEKDLFLIYSKLMKFLINKKTKYTHFISGKADNFNIESESQIDFDKTLNGAVNLKITQLPGEKNFDFFLEDLLFKKLFGQPKVTNDNTIVFSIDVADGAIKTASGDFKIIKPSS
jgi:hypothetical protein